MGWHRGSARDPRPNSEGTTARIHKEGPHHRGLVRVRRRYDHDPRSSRQNTRRTHNILRMSRGRILWLFIPIKIRSIVIRLLAVTASRCGLLSRSPPRSPLVTSKGYAYTAGSRFVHALLNASVINFGHYQTQFSKHPTISHPLKSLIHSSRASGVSISL